MRIPIRAPQVWAAMTVAVVVLLVAGCGSGGNHAVSGGTPSTAAVTSPGVRSAPASTQSQQPQSPSSKTHRDAMAIAEATLRCLKGSSIDWKYDGSDGVAPHLESGGDNGFINSLNYYPANEQDQDVDAYIKVYFSAAAAEKAFNAAVAEQASTDVSLVKDGALLHLSGAAADPQAATTANQMLSCVP